MKKFVPFLLLFGLTLSTTFAQTEEGAERPPSPRLNHNFDLALGGLTDFQIGSIAYQQEWELGKKRAWRLSYGARLSSYIGTDITHVSAPPDFYGDEATQDSVFVTNPQMNNIVVYIGATYVIKNRVELGFNIDAIGYTFGGDKDATFTAEGVETATTVNPGSVTALLVGANDIGMLKAEFFAAYKFNNTWKARVGLVSLFTEYRTPTELQAGNTRFRGEGRVPFLAVTYTPNF